MGATGTFQIASVSPLLLHGPFAVYVVALALIGLGPRRIRMNFMMAGMGTAPSTSAGSMPPIAAELMVNVAALQQDVATAAHPEVKCENCGFLERENGLYCRKYGEAL
jgi:hypothetical protein